MTRPLATAALVLALCAGAAGAGVCQQPTAAGERLIRELGCASCHPGLPAGEIRRASPPLAGPGSRLDPAYTFAYLAAPRAVRPGEPRMPDFGLDERERLALAEFLAGDADRADAAARDAYRRARATHRDVGAEEGRRIYVALNCAGCHTAPAVRPWGNAPDLRRLAAKIRPDWLHAYLRAPTVVRPFGDPPGTGGRMPNFRLTAAEADSIAAYLLRGAPPAPAPVARTLSPFQMEKAEALLRDRLPCLGCHRVDGEGGRIGPDLSAVAARLRPEYVGDVVADPHAAAPGTIMPRTPVPEAQRDLIVRYLLERPPTEPERTRPSLVDRPPLAPAEIGGRSGQALYLRYCSHCHGRGGAGDGWNAGFLPVRPTAHADGEYMAKRPDDTLYDGVHAGGYVLGRSARMPAFGSAFTDAEIRALVAYMRRLCDCEGPDWSRDGRRGAQ